MVVVLTTFSLEAVIVTWPLPIAVVFTMAVRLPAAMATELGSDSTEVLFVLS